VRSRSPVASLVGATCLAGSALWLGLRVQPSPLPAPSLVAAPVESAPLPSGLPAPVERFSRALYGEQVPVIDTIVISGRGTMRISGITFPSRYRFSHESGRAYRHYIETTVFGVPLLSVDEWFVDGAARLELPFGVSEGPQVDQGANLALWAELVWAPAVWLTDCGRAVGARRRHHRTAGRALRRGDRDLHGHLRRHDRAAPTDGVAALQGPAGPRQDALAERGPPVGSAGRAARPSRDRGALGRRAHAVGGPRTEQVLHNADLSTWIRAKGP
jgi:hypothetical protein